MDVTAVQPVRLQEIVAIPDSTRRERFAVAANQTFDGQVISVEGDTVLVSIGQQRVPAQAQPGTTLRPGEAIRLFVREVDPDQVVMQIVARGGSMQTMRSLTTQDLRSELTVLGLTPDDEAVEIARALINRGLAVTASNVLEVRTAMTRLGAGAADLDAAVFLKGQGLPITGDGVQIVKQALQSRSALGAQVEGLRTALADLAFRLTAQGVVPAPRGPVVTVESGDAAPPRPVVLPDAADAAAALNAAADGDSGAPAPAPPGVRSLPSTGPAPDEASAAPSRSSTVQTAPAPAASAGATAPPSPATAPTSAASAAGSATHAPDGPEPPAGPAPATTTPAPASSGLAPADTLAAPARADAGAAASTAAGAEDAAAAPAGAPTAPTVAAGATAAEASRTGATGAPDAAPRPGAAPAPAEAPAADATADADAARVAVAAGEADAVSAAGEAEDARASRATGGPTASAAGTASTADDRAVGAAGARLGAGAGAIAEGAPRPEPSLPRLLAVVAEALDRLPLLDEHAVAQGPEALTNEIRRVIADHGTPVEAKLARVLEGLANRGDLERLLATDLKSSLQALVQETQAQLTAAERLPPETVRDLRSAHQRAEALLGQVELQQLANAAPRPADSQQPSYLMFQLPIPGGREPQTAQIRIRQESDGRTSKIDPKNVHVVFQLELQNLSTVRVGIRVVDKHLSCQMGSSDPAATELLAEHAPELREGLAGLGYLVDPIKTATLTAADLAVPGDGAVGPASPRPAMRVDARA